MGKRRSGATDGRARGVHDGLAVQRTGQRREGAEELARDGHRGAWARLIERDAGRALLQRQASVQPAHVLQNLTHGVLGAGSHRRGARHALDVLADLHGGLLGREEDVARLHHQLREARVVVQQSTELRHSERLEEHARNLAGGEERAREADHGAVLSGALQSTLDQRVELVADLRLQLRLRLHRGRHARRHLLGEEHLLLPEGPHHLLMLERLSLLARGRLRLLLGEEALLLLEHLLARLSLKLCQPLLLREVRQVRQLRLLRVQLHDALDVRVVLVGRRGRGRAERRRGRQTVLLRPLRPRLPLHPAGVVGCALTVGGEEADLILLTRAAGGAEAHLHAVLSWVHVGAAALVRACRPVLAEARLVEALEVGLPEVAERRRPVGRRDTPGSGECEGHL